MKKLLRRLALRYLKLTWKPAQIIVVMDSQEVDSLWLSREEALKHIDRITKNAAQAGFDLKLRITSPPSRGNFIIDCQHGLYLP
jgi:hypothetical protein